MCQMMDAVEENLRDVPDETWEKDGMWTTKKSEDCHVKKNPRIDLSRIGEIGEKNIQEGLPPTNGQKLDREKEVTNQVFKEVLERLTGAEERLDVLENGKVIFLLYVVVSLIYLYLLGG